MANILERLSMEHNNAELIGSVQKFATSAVKAVDIGVRVEAFAKVPSGRVN
jgi:hypothetical protein